MSQLHPNNCLWLVDQNGILIYYNLESKQFETLPTCNQAEILFKSVASCKSSLWGVTCDCRLFLYVFSATNKVVEKLETWENQRWWLTGFSSKLLPTDRPAFSNFEGTKATPKDSFKLPSNNWSWKDEDWTVEDWQYAPDFSLNKQFTPEKTMLSLVRKRRHTRTAHYSKLNEWVEIASMFEDQYSDPILDVAVGGQEAIKDLNSTQPSRPDARETRNKHSLAVWLVTVSGKVYFRKNVCALRPEGTEFVEVPLNEILAGNNSSNDDDELNQQDLKIEEVNKITVNSYGLVWCLTSCARCLVRLGVTRDNLIGTYWQLVEPPFNSELGQISIGQDSVWAVDAKTNELWFRKGIRSSHAASNLTCAIGCSWVRLTNPMSYVSVNPFDQCWALSRSSKKLYFRMGIEPGNLEGKMWKLIARIQDTEGGANSNRDESESGSLNDLTIKSDVSERSSISTELNFVSNSSSVAYLANQTTNSWRCLNASTCLILNDQFFKANNYLFQKKHNPLKAESICEDQLDARGSMDSSSSMHSSMDQQWKNTIVSQLYERFENEMNPYKGKYSKAIENGSWLKSASVMYMANEAKIQDLMSLDLNSNNLQTNLVSQVSSYLYSNNSVLGYNYDKSDFIRCHLELDRDGSFSTTEAGTLTFKFVNENRRGKTTYKTNVVNLAEIICITSSAQITNFAYPNVLFIYLPKFLFIFAFDDEKELDDWFATLNVACNCLNNLNEAIFTPIHKPIALLISLFGQAYAGFLLSDRSVQTKRNKLKEKLEQNQQAQRNLKYKLFKFKEGQTNEEEGETEQSVERALADLKEEEIELSRLFEELLIKSSHCTDQCDRMFFLYLGGGNFKQLEYTSTGVLWGLSENGTPLVHTNCIGGSAYKNHLPNNNLNFLTDTQVYEIYENQRYYPFVGWQAKLLPTDRPLWSDESGLIELSREQTKLPSSEWKWCQKEWDSLCDSTTDEDGWQYAIDFSVEFHSQKRISDLVRRRKWCRLAKLETTGPWTQLTREDESAVCLRSISMYEANFNDEDDQKSAIILYAIAYNGECLVRIGVNKENHQGDKWLNVDCRERLKSVSVSGQLIKSRDSPDEHFIQVWAVAFDGNCLLRHNVSFENPAGDLWFYIESPASGPISKVMSCPANCFMLDKCSNFYFRDKIKVQFPEGLQWIKMNTKVKLLHASFPSSDCSRLLAVVEVLDRQNRSIVLVICQNFNNSYNLTENYDFKWRSLIRNAFKYVTCA